VTFAFVFALVAVVFVGAPYVAHRLRRRKAESRLFAAVHLVPPAPPRARRRSMLEDRALFVTRALAVLGLALLGASPFVHCARLSLSRTSGASVALALVIDDSMSMQAKLGTKARFERAKQGARQLLASTREGDAVAVVLAGAPARIALAPTTDLESARSLVESITETDRATDLDGALALARGIVLGLPQLDRRIVVASDLADGRPSAPPLGEAISAPLWNALPELRADGHDCGILRADRAGLRVTVRVACTPGFAATKATPRKVSIVLGERTLADGALPELDAGDVVLALPADALAKAEEPGALVARLSGSDPVAADDVAPVVTVAPPGSVAVVVPGDTEIAATGGAPVVEQALSALALGISTRPLPQIPDRPDDLAPFLGIIIDDPPGFTPEERRALGAFVAHGGVVLVALGPRASAAPLGASFEPFLTQPVRWEPTTSAGADPATAAPLLAESAASLAALGAQRRAGLRPEDAAQFTPLLEWTDHAPLVARRAMGRGEAWLVTLPFALDASDLPLRPAFLSLLEEWIDAAKARATPKRTEVGMEWTFPGAARVVVTGPRGEEVPVARDGAMPRVTPVRVGLYRINVDGRNETRVAEPAQREIDLRPRALALSAAGGSMGENRASIDASPGVALALLALLAIELALRVRAGQKIADSGES